ncbi:hypothetical protein OF83DRAFT_1157429 [Amylostereum chailletii]|nr:hypothetical protein OF83DRAFT_1157429 [Amylostereum chailletii]
MELHILILGSGGRKHAIVWKLQLLDVSAILPLYVPETAVGLTLASKIKNHNFLSVTAM